MATLDQVKSLVKAFVDHDDDKFKTVVLQIAAHEAKAGHDTIARDLKKLMDNVETRKASVLKLNSQNSMLDCSMPSVYLNELVVSDSIMDKIHRILNEYKNKNKLYAFGLSNRRKILIEGKPGTGKTMTAEVIASEVGLPLYTVEVDKLVTKFMGETSSRLRQVFDNIETRPGVYLFDEFDAIGADRALDNEVGEMRRILNSFLQFIEQDTSESIIIAATNNVKILDQALFRRFDEVLHYELPSPEDIRRLFRTKFENAGRKVVIDSDVIKNAVGLSQAEISRVCDDAIKNLILNETEINSEELNVLLKERHKVYMQKEA